MTRLTPEPDMSDVPRYTFPADCSPRIAGDGDYVAAADYDALASRLAEAEQSKTAYELASQDCRNLTEKVIPALRERLAEAERRVKELEAQLEARVAVSPKEREAISFGATLLQNEGMHSDAMALRDLWKRCAALSPRHQSAEGAEGEGT